MSAFEPRLAVLPAAQQEIWPLLAPTADMGLVLYGGTAVALRLGHRQSVDFDFFTEKQLDVDGMAKTLEFLKRSTVIQSRPDTLSVLTPALTASVKISFFGAISIGRAGAPDVTQDGVLVVASLLDLLATKLKVIQQRIEAKDYFDIAAILCSGLRLGDGLAAAEALYAPAFQPSEALKALTYFEGGDLHTLSVRDKNVLTHAASTVRRVPSLGLASRSLSLRSDSAF